MELLQESNLTAR